MSSVKDVKDKVEQIVGVGDKKAKKDGSACGCAVKWFSDLKHSSKAVQVTVGSTSGFASGFVFGRLGRTAGSAVGATAICLHMAQKYGYIKINWKKVDSDVAAVVEEVVDDVENVAAKKGSKWIRQVKTFVADNVFLATGFAGGFFLGLASS